MFSKATSFTCLSAFIAVFLSQSCTARDLRVFPSSNACSGAWLVCSNLAPWSCCGNGASNWASHQVTGGSDGVTLTAGFSHPNCQGTRTEANGNGCVSASFAIHSGLWQPWRTSVPARAMATISAETQRNTTTGKCAEFDSFGYMDESGQTFQALIPGGKEKEIFEAVKNNDLDVVKSLL